jgi:hypothetical protein
MFLISSAIQPISFEGVAAERPNSADREALPSSL